MKTRLYPLAMLFLDHRFLWSLSTIYSGRSRGRYPWLTKRQPNGRMGRALWVVEHEFNAFAANRGIKFRVPLDGNAVTVAEGWQH
jgi:hypothetical protein